jgi:protocatechuate 3,4-dioxygenase beta subunit
VRILAFVVGIISLLCISTVAQTPAQEASGSISGRVTISGKGAAGINVTARAGDSPLENRTVARATTDNDGNYRLIGLPAGRFTITPIAKAYVVAAGEHYKAPGQAVNLAENESIKNFDFALIRGGVITGRITDLEGRPIIGERVNVAGDSYAGSVSPMMMFPGGKNQTDDRGVYRIYGLPPGSYKVSVGQTSAAGAMNIVGMGGSQYSKTFYPGVTDESKATPIEIKEGTEATNIDITPGKLGRGFAVSGRVVDAESGQPIANTFIGYKPLDSGDTSDTMSFTGNQTDTNGRFRIEGIKPGRYAAFTISATGESSGYSDLARFEISEGDVTGIEIKVRRGATVEGVAVIENNVDPGVTALLRSISLFAYTSDTKGSTVPSYSRSAINADGGFKLTGLSPGKLHINMMSFPKQPKGLHVIRTELNGVGQPEGIDVSAGAQITGVRLVFAYGSTRIRGEVKTEGGVLPQGTTFVVTVTATGHSDNNRFIEVDSRGHFVVEDVPPGVYLLTARSPAKTAQFQSATRTITITNEVEVPVTLVIDLSKKVEPQ